MSCNDACAVEKAEAKEFAYFSGLTKGAQLGAQQERKRIETELINNKRRFTEYLADGRLVCFSYMVIDLLKEIDEEKK